MAPRVRVGTIGWNHPEWRGHLYPPRAKPEEFLRRYADRYDLVEAASSYYGMPRTASVAKWAADTPEGFEISLKIPDWLVEKRPDDPDLARALGTLLAHLAPLSDVGKLGTLVAQFHPSHRRDAKRAAALTAFVRALPPGPRWAVELRHDSWWVDDTYDALREAGVALVWSLLERGWRTPPVMTTDAVYVRLLGDRDLEPPYDRKRRDATEELHRWADRIEHEASGAKRVDVLVSKHLEGYAPGTADALREMLHVARPTPRGARQTTLM